MGKDAESIAVVIPVLDGQGEIGDVLDSAIAGHNIKLIVVDGGSSDGTPEIVERAGVRLLRSFSNRSVQMNAGAAEAHSDILLFLHGDTRLPPGYESLVREAVAFPGVSMGAFRLGIDAEGWPYRLIETVANWRSRFLSLPYGDQAYFMRCETFQRLGGFNDLPIMEDYDFVRRARRQGRIVILNTKVNTSARRWKSLGPVRTTLINYLVVLGYHLGVSAERLAAWYGRIR